MRNPHQTTRSRPKLPSRAALTIVLGLAMLAGACSKGDAGQSDTPVGAPPVSSETPKFDFVVDRITPYTAVPGKLPKGIPPEVQKASDQISADMSIMYKAGYLDPNNWRNGEYDSFFHYFNKEAGAEAKGQIDELTAGTAAGEMYEDIQPGFAHLNTKVMLDAKGKPILGVAIVDFNATATGKDGLETNLGSDGQYFMQPEGGSWRILAYDVNRQDGGDIPTTPEPGDSPDDKPKKDDKNKKDKEEEAA